MSSNSPLESAGAINRNWVKTKFSDVCTITRGASPRPIISWVSNQGTPWVKISDATSEPGRYISKTKEYIKNEGRTKSVVVHPGDLVVSNSATPGLPKFLKIEACIHDGWLLLRNFKNVLPEYLYYVVENDRKELVGKGSGSIFTNLKTEILKNHELYLPTLREQERIAEILGQIDDKLALNIQLTRTLEAIAQAIFTSWFSDLDPVKAKMSGEAPAGMDSESASLFPDSMVKSEIGMIPTGWEVVPSTEMFEILSGGTPKTTNEEYWNGEIPWFSVVDAPNEGGCFFIKTAKTITNEGLKNSAARLVRPGVTVISARGTVGKTAIVAVHSTFNQSCYGVEGKYGDFFTYLLLKTQISRLQSISHGGMFDTITRETFSSVLVSKPSLELMSHFESIVEPIFHEIRNLQFQNQKLTNLRDALLPRLISGELQIPEELLAS